MSSTNGVIKVLTRRDRSYYDADDVQELLGCKKSKAYQIINALRGELIGSGKLTALYPQGKIPKSYFNERCYIEGETNEKKKKAVV